MENRSPNIIQFEKDIWFQDCKVLFSEKDVLQQTFQNYTNLEQLTLRGRDTIKIEEKSFDNLKNLISLNIHVKSVDFHEFLFKNLKKLKELSLRCKAVFNDKHSIALDNLESLKLFCTFNGQIKNLLNLKKLTLNSFSFQDFSFKNFQNLETLNLKRPHFYNVFYNKIPKDLFSDLTSLKNLAYYDDRILDDKSLGLIKELFVNLPAKVAKFECNNFIFDIFHSNKTPFIYKLKSLVITIESEIDFSNYFLFHENLFPCLESIDLRKKQDHINRQSISIELFKKLKKLKVLKLDEFSLVGIDKDLNYLEEASFGFQLPENISNFSNLKKLHFKNSDQIIEYSEDFLEDLINLEELVLDNVVISIDSNAQYLFKKLIKLKVLKLTNVTFSNLRSTYFDCLVNLEKLDLQYSYFESSFEESPFRNLKKLNYLNLSNCTALKPFDKAFFAGLINLNTLDISFESNRLSAEKIEFKKDSFTDLKNLSSIFFFHIKN